MFLEILNNLPYLFLLIGANILLGIYFNVEKLKENFSWKKLIAGIIKGLIISYTFAATALACDKVIDITNITQLEYAPNVIMLMAIAYYLTKDLLKLKTILMPDNKEGAKEEENTNG